ncbi:MAG: YbaN family protein [Tissierellia bacterium]|nr:YbaN family protein [Tissierellia bacterium]
MKIIYNGLGFLCLGLGILGIYLPVLPTTPFLLLAATCFGKGSERFHHWFLNTSLYEKYLEPFLNHKGIELTRKVKILGTTALVMTFSFYMMKNIYGRIFLILVFLSLSYYVLFKIKTIEKHR